MRTLDERFWSKVAINGPNDCWPWQRGRFKNGYGQFRVRTGESTWTASRVAWLLTHGYEPGEFLVCHHCDNRRCCNPHHLFLGTHADNMADMAAKGRAPGRTGPPTRQNVAQLVAAVRKLSDADVANARARVAAGESRRNVARSLGVAHTTISRMIREEHWRPGPGGLWSWQEDEAS